MVEAQLKRKSISPSRKFLGHVSRQQNKKLDSSTHGLNQSSLMAHINSGKYKYVCLKTSHKATSTVIYGDEIAEELNHLHFKKVKELPLDEQMQNLCLDDLLKMRIKSDIDDLRKNYPDDLVVDFDNAKDVTKFRIVR